MHVTKKSTAKLQCLWLSIISAILEICSQNQLFAFIRGKIHISPSFKCLLSQDSAVYNDLKRSHGRMLSAC